MNIFSALTPRELYALEDKLSRAATRAHQAWAAVRADRASHGDTQAGWNPWGYVADDISDLLTDISDLPPYLPPQVIGPYGPATIGD